MPAFDPSQPFEEVTATKAPAFDESQPFEPVQDPSADHWKGLYSGLDQQPPDPVHAAALQAMGQKLTPDKEMRAQAINMAYVAEKLPGMTPQYLMTQWPNVRTAYSQQAGFTQGEDVSDVQLYGHIAKAETEAETKARIAHEMVTAGSNSARFGIVLNNFGHLFKLNAAEFWGDINKPFKEIPAVPQLPDIPAMGYMNPAIVGGLANALKPIVEGVETPLGLATIGAGSVLKSAAAVGVPLAQKAIGGISGLFAGLMAKGAIEATPESLKVLKDPNSSTQDKITAAGRPVVDAAMAIFAGLHAVSELSPQGKAAVKAMEGKTPAEAAEILHQEANNLPASPENLPAIEAMRDTAGKLLEIPGLKVGEKPISEAAKADPATTTQPEAQKPVAAQEPAAAEPPVLSEPKPVTAEETIRTFSIKKAALDKEMKAQGDEPTTKAETISDKMAMDTAAETLRADPEAGAKLVDELSGPNPRPVSHNDVMLLQHEWTRLTLERDHAQAALDAATKAGDEMAMATAADRVESTRTDLATTAEVIRQTTGGQGRAFRAIGLALKEDYSLAAVEQRMKEANPKAEVTPEESAAVKDLTEQLKAAEKKYEDYRRRASELLQEDKRARQPGRGKPPSALMAKLSEEATAARARLKAKMTSGRLSAGIDPTDLADMAIIGAEHLAKGVTKFADWSKTMVEEFGTRVMPHLKDIYDKATQHKALEGKLEAKKKRILASTEELKRRLSEGDLEPKAKREAIQLDEEGVKLEAEKNRLKEEIQKRIIQRKIAAMSFPEKAASKLVKWRRGFLLSSPTTLVKLTAAAAQRMAFTPIEEVMGSLFSKVPGLSDIAGKAPREGGINFQAEAEAITAAFTKGMSDAATVLKTGKGVLDSAFGHKAGVVHESDVVPQSFIEFFGHLHAALKSPVKRAEFTRSFRKIITHYIKNGADGTDPMIQTRVAVEAYKEANKSIFMQDNIVTDAYKRALSRFEEVNKDTGEPSAFGKTASTISRVLLPIVKVPTNIVAETSQYATGLGTGTIRAIVAMAKGVDTLKPEQADLIMRELKKGSIGGAALLLGYMNPDIFGGYYQPGEKRKETDAKALSIRAGGIDIPSIFLHSPLMETFQIGATVRRVADSKLHKHDREEQGILGGAWAAGLGLLEEVPFAKESVEMAKLFDPHERGYMMGELLKSMLVPAVVQWLATNTDRDSSGEKIKRKPKTILQHVESGIPGLRQNVPAKSGGTVSPRD